MHASFSANAVADEAPADTDAGIVQPVGPIEKYCWIIRKSTGGNNVYRCKLCAKEFTGSKIVVATSSLHYVLLLVWCYLGTSTLSMVINPTSQKEVEQH